MDIVNEFLSQYNETAPDATEFQKLTPEQVQELEQKTFAINEQVGLSIFDPTVRQQFARTATGDVPELLRACATLMAKRPELASHIGATPQIYLDAAERGLALRGLLLSSSDLAQSASDGVLCCSHLLAEACNDVFAAIQAAETDPDISEKDRADVRGVSGTALRVRDDIARKAAESAQRAVQKSAATAQDVQNTEIDNLIAQHLDQFLAEARVRAAGSHKQPASKP